MSERVLVPNLVLIICITLSAVLTAFATDQRQTPMVMGAAGEAVDSALHDKVLTVLKGDPGLAGSRLSVVTQGGIVTLSGTVPTEQTLNRTLELASNVRGVREVHSNLVVQPVE